MTQTVGFTGSGTGNVALAATNQSKLILNQGGSPLYVTLAASQILDYIYVRSSSSNGSASANIEVNLYDITGRTSNPTGAPRILQKTVALPNNALEQWIQFGPFSDDLSAHSGKVVAIALGIPDAAYAIRQQTAGASTDASNTGSGVDSPDPWTNTANSSNVMCVYATTRDAPSGPTITDVDTDNDVYPGQNAVYTGTGFGSAQGTGTITLTSPSGLTTIDQPESAWGDTGVTAEVVNVDGDSAIPFKSGVTVTLYNDDGTSDTHTITLSPPEGTTVVDVVSPDTTSASLFQDTTPAVADGDQVWYEVVSGTSVVVNANGTLTSDSATAEITFRIWDATDETISAEYTATLQDGVVSVGGVSFSGISFSGISFGSGVSTSGVSTL